VDKFNLAVGNGFGKGGQDGDVGIGIEAGHEAISSTPLGVVREPSAGSLLRRTVPFPLLLFQQCASEPYLLAVAFLFADFNPNLKDAPGLGAGMP
jgi:hypothetical protein